MLTNVRGLAFQNGNCIESMCLSVGLLYRRGRKAVTFINITLLILYRYFRTGCSLNETKPIIVYVY